MKLHDDYKATWEESLYIGSDTPTEIEVPFVVVAEFDYTQAEPQSLDCPGEKESVDIHTIRIEGLTGAVADSAVALLNKKVEIFEQEILSLIRAEREESKVAA